MLTTNVCIITIFIIVHVIITAENVVIQCHTHAAVSFCFWLIFVHCLLFASGNNILISCCVFVSYCL